MMKQHTLTELIKRIQSISQLGLSYTQDAYDMERYNELKEISQQMIHIVTNVPLTVIDNYFNRDKEYITPKTDIRAVVFNERKEILLVKEKSDGLWSLPGGWADIGLTPSEVAVSEVKEETGLDVTVVKLLAVLDKRCHAHPPQADYVYKFFIQCCIKGGAFKEVFDIAEAGFFTKDSLPPLSLIRVLPEQVQLMFEYLDNPLKPVTLD
jgi:ADP-ribose pyrophosphatase YjhB (NUDIX family)